MIQQAEYAVTLTSTGPKQGVVESHDSGLPPLRVTAPPEFGGESGEWSPEHLLVAAVASCFITTFRAIAELSRLELLGMTVPGVGTIERGDDRRYRFVRIVLTPRIAIAAESDRERAARIVRKAEEACLVTRSLSTPVEVDAVLAIGELSPSALSS